MCITEFLFSSALFKYTGKIPDNIYSSLISGHFGTFSIFIYLFIYLFIHFLGFAEYGVQIILHMLLNICKSYSIVSFSV